MKSLIDLLVEKYILKESSKITFTLILLLLLLVELQDGSSNSSHASGAFRGANQG